MTADRLCRKCGRWLPVTAFRGDYRSSVNGRMYPRTTCRDCGRFMQANRRAQPEPVKGKTRVCNVCGVEKPLAEFYRTSTGTRERRCKVCTVAAQMKRLNERLATDPEWAAQYRARQAANQRKRLMRRALERFAS